MHSKVLFFNEKRIKMKIKKTVITVLIFCFVISSGFSQEKSKKELRREQKEKEKIEKEKQTEALIETKAFVFTANRALPSGARTIDLTGDNYFVKFENDSIESFMPFFGRAYGGVGYGTDVGIKFKEAPKTFNIKKAKKSYEIEAVIKDDKDTYNLTLSISFQGSASLFVTSNNRSTISYQGILEAIKNEGD